MLGILVEALKYLLVILGILVVGSIIGSIIAQPFKRKKQKEQAIKVIKELNEIADKCIEEFKKEQENKNKTTRKTTKKTTKKEEK